MRRSLTPIVVAAAMSMSIPALAQEKPPSCPPGSWFCADADVHLQPVVPPVVQQAPERPKQEAPQAAPPPVVVEEPVQPVPDAPPPEVHRPRRPPAAPPPVVIYQPVPDAPPPQIIVIAPGYGYGYGYGRPVRPVPPPPAAPKPQRWQSEFGINLRVEGIVLGHPGGSSFNAGMGGVGLSLRYRPVPHFAFDLGADVLAGNDYNGFQRMEVPVSLNGIIYLNPRSRVQVYLIGGANVSRAEVRSDSPAPQLSQRDDGSFGATYTYFGGQGGLGLEFRLSKRIAIDLDGLAFIRKRIGDIKAPEFIDPSTGQTTNTSAGGLFRGGLQFWW
jgi:opacity protein-like surface antigen